MGPTRDIGLVATYNDDIIGTSTNASLTCPETINVNLITGSIRNHTAEHLQVATGKL